MFVVACFLLLLPGAVEVSLAPDQPMPFVYVDDPLVIEMVSDADMAVEGTLFLQAAHTGGSVEIALGDIFLYGGAVYWHAVHNAPGERGFYTAEVVLTEGEETHRGQARFCRIDRPAQLQRLPLYAHCSGTDDTCAVTAIRSVGVDTLRLDLNNPHLDSLASAVAEMGLQLIIMISADALQDIAEETIAILHAHCEAIVRFEILDDASDQGGALPLDMLRPIGCPAGVSVVVPHGTAFRNILEANPGITLRHVTLAGTPWPDMQDIYSIKRTAAYYGFEGWYVHVSASEWHPKEADHSARFIHRFMLYRAAGVSYIGLNAAVVADDMGVQEMMSYLNGLALRLTGQSFVGALPAPENGHALLFRTGASWFAALWSEQGTVALSVPVDGAVNLRLTDALGNTLELPEPEEGSITLTVGQDPLYLTGHGGVIFGRAALEQTDLIINRIKTESIFSEHLSQSLMDTVAAIGAAPHGAGSRLRFLEVLRLLPRLEEQWHGRQLPRHVAVPAIAELSALARSLCLIEEDRGEHFLEPLSDMLARTEELQSLYLTGSAGTARARERGDWILGEVRRLASEAEVLDAADRKIEASAVAALAEWRAQGLKFAAQAEPFRESPPEIKPLVIPEPALPPGEEMREEDAPPQAEGDDVQEGEEEEEGEEKEKEAEDVSTDEEEVVETDEEGDTVITHTVVSGDNPFNIARKYNVSLDDLLEWNNMRRNVILRVGQELTVHVSSSN